MSRVRPLASDDLERVLQWRNHPNVRRFMLTQHEISPDEHRSWFARKSADPTRRLLLVEDEDVPLGFVQFSGVANGAAAEWGFYAAPEAPGGSGHKLGVAALDFAFQSLGLHKVCGQALAFNDGSIRLHERLGFRREGVLREQHRIDNAYHDMLCFGLLCSEWPSHPTARHTDELDPD